MAAAVVQADNRCVGGGGDLPPAAAAASATIEQQTADDDRKRIDGARNGRSSSSLSSLSSLSSNDDDDDDDNHDHRHRRRRRRGSVNDATAGNGQMVAVKRLKYLKQRVIDLDDLELLDRHLDNAAIDDAGAEALYGADVGALAADLRQKNKDLVLAARLGKALLAKNDELSLMNERLAEEYGDKLEVWCIYRSTIGVVVVSNNTLLIIITSPSPWTRTVLLHFHFVILSFIREFCENPEDNYTRFVLFDRGDNILL